MFSAFVVAAFVLAVTPGPGILYILTRTLSQGRGAGMASVAGVALGNLGNALLASFGLAAVMATSSAAYLVVKYAGAAYLVFLGVQALRMPTRNLASGVPPQQQPKPSNLRILLDGLVVAVLNPKTALFFAAFVPPFMDATAAPFGQSLTLSCTFVAIAFCTDLAYVLLAARVAPVLRGTLAPRYGGMASALVYFGLGVWAALVEAPRR